MGDLPKVNEDFITTLSNAVRERLASPVWGTFILSWLAVHWRIVYVSLFVSNESILNTKKVLKDEYVYDLFHPFDIALVNVSYNFLLPAVITFLVIWVLPRWVFIPAFKKDYGDYIEKQKYKAEQDIQLGEKNVKKLKTEVARVQEEKKILKQDPTFVWDKDYKEFQNSIYSDKLPLLTSVVYEDEGSVYSTNNFGDRTGMKIDSKTLAYFDAMGIVEFEEGKVSLTAKGKYFIARSSAIPF